MTHTARYVSLLLMTWWLSVLECDDPHCPVCELGDDGQLCKQCDDGYVDSQFVITCDRKCLPVYSTCFYFVITVSVHMNIITYVMYINNVYNVTIIMLNPSLNLQ